MQFKTSTAKTQSTQTLLSQQDRENEPFDTLDNLSSPQGLLSTLQELRQTVATEGKVTFDQWNRHIQRPEFLASASNLAEYLALRRHDLRPLQASGTYALGLILPRTD
jgi:pyruvate kinase